MAGLKKGLVGWIINKLKEIQPQNVFFTLYYTSASTMRKTLGYFLCAETNRFCNELYLGSRIESLSLMGWIINKLKEIQTQNVFFTLYYTSASTM